MSEDALDITAGLPADLLAAATEAMAATEPERGRAFATLCATHPGHAATLQRLFAELSAVERLLDGGYGPRQELPTQLGRYRVLRKLGSGAFGEVFLCEQVEPVRRNVAVKVLRAGAGDRTTLLRFEAERQLIASMQHPAIAQVFDAGALGDGRPFFVMDAIDGTPIDRWCDDHASSVEARIELFCELCRGVQHAHDRGIVHRDLKPANVLVVDIDGQPRPKVIDFGIAKVLQGSGVARSFDTEAGRVIGTPGYMSPEQQKGSSEDVDARADVFCLGVMLYELLCGQLPWSVGAAATDTDPARPSTRVSTSAGTAATIARDRATQPRRLASRLRGDLDWIVLKCLHRERAARYQSVQELIDDLERHRRAEPVHALPPSTTYRLKRLVRRHRTAVLALGSATLVAICSLALVLHDRRSVGAEIDAAMARADASFATATAAVERLLERANDPLIREAPEGDATRQAMLGDALSFYDRFVQERPTDPAVRARRCRALLDLTHVHVLLGEAPRANESARTTVREAEALWSEAPSDSVLRGLLGEALCEDGRARSLAGDVAGAVASFTAAIDHLAVCAADRPAQFGLLHAIALRCAANATPRQTDELAWLQASLQVIEKLQSVAPAADIATEYVLTACDLGEVLHGSGRLAESEAVLRQAAERLPLVAAERLHLSCRVSMLRANVAFQRGERHSTLEHYQAALTAATAWEQAQPRRLEPRVLHARTLRQLGYAQNYAGDFDDSVASYRQAIAIGEEVAARMADSKGRTIELTRMLEEYSITLLDRFDRRVLADAAACAERAVILEQEASGDVPSERRWRFLALRAAIADARVGGGGDEYWPAVEAVLVEEPEVAGRELDQLVGTYASLARWHLDHGRLAAATRWLQKADATIARDPPQHGKRAVEAGWLTARLAAAHADHAACAAAAERILAARSTWYGRRRAADCLHLAWRCASREPGTEEVAAGYRDRALDSYRRVKETLEQDVAQHPDDPWFVLPWAVASIRAAELSVAAADATAARPLLAAALPRLEAVRAVTPADLFDEQVLSDGRALQAQLPTTDR
ncbi:MAG: serine/threonine protein kinase [Planctomycetes bacterium]|nr:serine/threonine protein kinase [Planctomycetota bacterium]